ncbi:MAG: YbjN domain-containing protein [Methyloligellaceae bacterium]
MASTEPIFERLSNPVDMVERIATVYDWAFERNTDDELSLSVAGTWSDYHISLNWRDDVESLHMACAFDLKVPAARLNEIYRLIASINEQMWIGHFDLWRKEGMLLFRHGLMLNGAEPTVGQCEALLQAALEGCERYYQAFQFVIWAGKSAESALAGTMFETEGQA